MSVHITKTYNIGGLIGLRQNAVKNAGETLGFKEMSLFKFPDAYDSDDELHVRMDGIIAYLIGTVLSFSVISSIIICICQGGPLFLQFGGYVDASLAMLPCSIMMTTGLWISLYREAEVYRNMDRYHTFI